MTLCFVGAGSGSKLLPQFNVFLLMKEAAVGIQLDTQELLEKYYQ